MAKLKNEGTIIIILLGIAVFLLFQGQSDGVVPSGDNGGVDLCKLVDGTASFTGQRMFLSGTALTTEYARVVKMGSIMDLGQVSLDSGTLSTSPNGQYKLYFCENSTSADYYTNVQNYQAPCQDATDDVVGVCTQVSETPTTTVFDENGQVNTNTANAQAIGANEIVNVEVKIKAQADECWGNPDAPGKNAICFDYNSTVYDSVKANTASSVAPYAISSSKGAGLAESCYEFDLLCDTESQVLTVTIDASSTEPTFEHNITITLGDIAFDLDQDTLEEIWGFEDESNNNLGATTAVTDTVHVS